ncbi:YciI family protein [Paracidovorax valerianellae]|uniref:Uncharacterized conserved protein YciI, contains a putative active-site phosphohistidine n=1 Tax=Paracidovorax valerianellae TaxID=187868 RepID=A0A1G6M6M3_9BURK|nr:YciI family protein [Paracidovorax valerianellae]MDA8446075.1 YciI family protein [Paracidovorax valerianellae]SDC51212.1 Uncharacterized conserved protein YciI, contains a putative active-site phosphohistidine [Paracidovorax valerianellae]
MLYVLTLHYIRPPEEIQLHLDSHRQWLARHIRAGRILVAGRSEDRTGGVVIASCEGRDELDRMIADDSFVIHELVQVSVQSFEPAVCAHGLPQGWASNAAVVKP